MNETIGIIMPAHRAERIIAAAAKSVLAQTFKRWLLVVIADDGADYEAVLGRAGLADPRFRFAATSAPGSGASRTRNAGLDWIDTDFVATLDADDRFKPQKLELCAQALGPHAIVSTGLDVVDNRFRHLRYVGGGQTRTLTAGAHKWVNLSMDSMIIWDRRRADARYDPSLPNMNDLDFLIRLYAGSPASFHIGRPLHDYVKMDNSLSNGAGATDRMIVSKTLILKRLREGYYGLAAEAQQAGLEAFLEISLRAEAAYPMALAANQDLLFENHIEPMLRASPHAAAYLNAASTSPA